MGSYKWLSAVSKTQCEITKCPQGVFLKDRSSNGTWVNGHRVSDLGRLCWYLVQSVS